MPRYMIDVDADGQPVMVYDMVDKKLVTICKTYYGAKDVCNLLNKKEDEIKTLQEEISNAQMIFELKKENERLQKELDNFKPVVFQDMRKGTIVLYSKG